jgi:hypothetical protein
VQLAPGGRGDVQVVALIWKYRAPESPIEAAGIPLVRRPTLPMAKSVGALSAWPMVPKSWKLGEIAILARGLQLRFRCAP